MLMTQTKVAVSGFTSNSGKTTLMCELLRAFPGWEAIKMTRGHYRSCGRDPHACCVSDLLGDEPVVRSGRAETYTAGKDTGRYWDAGAANVHWVIVTDRQVERGIKLALERTKAPGVLIEGNSFLEFVEADFRIMAARFGEEKMKASARRALPKSDALFTLDEEEEAALRGRVEAWAGSSLSGELLGGLPLYTRGSLSKLLARVRSVHERVQTPYGEARDGARVGDGLFKI
jgi:molybdopterin-guanine dinucleotide biosynthesis protein